MKKGLLSLILCLGSFTITSAYMPYYDIKAKLLGGSVLKHTKHLENTVKGPTLGAEIAIEFLPQGKYNWEKYYGYPTIGVGFIGMDLGNPKIFGQAFIAYPYTLIPMVNRNSFKFNFKIGAGLAVLTKTYKHTSTADDGTTIPLNNTNAAIASHVNVFLPLGLSFDIPIGKGFMISADAMFNHISNGSVIQPNSGLNMINVYVGAAYRPNWREYMNPWKDYVKDEPHDWQLEFCASGGLRQLYYKDNRFYGIASGRVSGYKQFTNIYKLGASFDLFYDGVFVTQGESILNTKFKRYHILSNDPANKIRLGFSIANEVVMGRLTAGLHWGIYLYDPIKNAYNLPNSKTGQDRSLGYKRGFLYKYNIEEEDGWNYFRLILKYRVWDNLFVSAGLKTHLQKAEFVEFGLGYTIHFKTKRSPYSTLQ